MKIKKLLATVLVAICAFVLVGCGQMNAKQSVESSVSSATSIETSVKSMLETGNEPSGTLSVKANPTAATFLDYQQMTEDFSEVMQTLIQNLNSLGSEIIETKNLADEFIADYVVYEELITDEDVAKLNDCAKELKNIKSQVENKANAYRNKYTDLQNQLKDIDFTQIDSFEDLQNALQNVNLDKIIDITEVLMGEVNAVNQIMADAQEALEDLNDVLDNYVVDVL